VAIAMLEPAMRFSLAWLRELAPVPAEVGTGEIAQRLTAAGFHVEGVEETAGDTVLEVDVTTNRVDAMCHLGLARELAALFSVPLRDPAAEAAAAAGAPVVASAVRPPVDHPGIDIAAPTLCRRYVGVVIRGVTVGPSPEWLQRRLLAIGSRPINNVVDVTNYVLWERGQPLHAFDLPTLGSSTPDAEQHVIVREARAGESVRTLDGEERRLAAGMLVIADRRRPIALAGVMGGQETEVGEGTRDVLLESAWFDPKTVRRTAKALAMHTDASHRFERGVDPEGQLVAARRAAALLAELAGGTVVEPAIDAAGEQLPPQPEIVLSHRRLERFAGAAIPPPEVERLLDAIGFDPIRVGGGEEWRVGVPSWRRFDVLEEADLFEEVLRLHGFDRIAAALPAVAGADAPELPGHRLRRAARQQLAASGFVEAIDYAFYGAAEDERFAPFGAAATDLPGPALLLSNPLSERHVRMRRSLLPGLLESASFNRRRGVAALRLFEVGHVFWQGEDGAPREAEHVALVAGGREGSPWQRTVELDLFDAKGAVEALAAALGRELVAEPADVRGLLPGRAARLLLGDAGRAAVGILGQVDESEDGFPLFVAELATEPFLPLPAPVRVRPPSRQPGVEVDLTLTHALDVPWAAIAAAIEEVRPPELVSFELENRYQGPGVPLGAVNTTTHFLYHAPDRTLSQEEVNARQSALAALLQERFGWRGDARP
jgi:phenylalanyl-tRNA synthetase beta chain